jgi:hypothetical protein
MRLSRDGETLLVGGYTTPVATRRHTVWHRLPPAELHTRLLAVPGPGPGPWPVLCRPSAAG